MMSRDMSTDPAAPYTNAQGTPDGSSPSPAPQAASLWEDFVDILYVPSEVYARRASSGFWVPTIVVALLVGLLFLATRGALQPIMDAEFQRGMARTMAKNPQVTADMAERFRGFGETMATLFAFIGIPLAVMLTGLAAWLVGKLFDAGQTLRATLMVVAYASVPRVVESLVVAVQGLMLDTSALDGRYRLTLGAARFLDPDTTAPLVLALLAPLDVFTIWTTVLIAIGIAVVGRIPRSRAFAVAAIVWLLGSIPVIFSAVISR
jgi:hypothetical protein